MALAAAELDPSLTLDLDPEAVSFYHESTLVGWDSRLRDHPTQVAARQGVALISKEMKRKDGSVTPAHVPWSAAWRLRRDQVHCRSTLGEKLRSMKTWLITGGYYSLNLAHISATPFCSSGGASPSACGMTWMTGPAPHSLPAQ